MHNLLFFISIFIFDDIKADTLNDPLRKYLGKIQDNSSTYNSLGSYKGRVESNGGIYNSLGKYLGKIETNGHSYDSRAGYMGRIDSCLLYTSPSPRDRG